MKNMNNKTYSDYLEMVRKDGYFLKNVPPEYQTEEICMEAVKYDGLAIRFVGEQIPTICLEAVKQNGWAIGFIKNQNPEICLAAVKQNGMALEYVKEQTPEICLEAVKQDGNAIVFVKNQTPELCLEAVKEDGLALKFVEEQTPEICMAAVKQCGHALKWVKNQTEELCLEAVKKNHSTLSYIKDRKLVKKIEDELIESKLFKETDSYRAFITDDIICDSSYKSLKDNIERPVTIVLDTTDNDILISFKDSETKCNAKDILDSLGDYDVWGTNSSAGIDLNGLSDNKMSELFTDVIMKVDESVREHYDLSKDISEKNIKDVDDMEL